MKKRHVVSHPYPEEPDPHVTDPSHGGEDKVHGDGGDENIVQWENLMEEEKLQPGLDGKLCFSHSQGLQNCHYSSTHTTNTFQALVSTKRTIKPTMKMAGRP